MTSFLKRWYSAAFIVVIIATLLIFYCGSFKNPAELLRYNHLSQQHSEYASSEMRSMNTILSDHNHSNSNHSSASKIIDDTTDDHMNDNRNKVYNPSRYPLLYRNILRLQNIDVHDASSIDNNNDSDECYDSNNVNSDHSNYDNESNSNKYKSDEINGVNGSSFDNNNINNRDEKETDDKLNTKKHKINDDAIQNRKLLKKTERKGKVPSKNEDSKKKRRNIINRKVSTKMFFSQPQGLHVNLNLDIQILEKNNIDRKSTASSSLLSSSFSIENSNDDEINTKNKSKKSDQKNESRNNCEIHKNGIYNCCHPKKLKNVNEMESVKNDHVDQRKERDDKVDNITLNDIAIVFFLPKGIYIDQHELEARHLFTVRSQKAYLHTYTASSNPELLAEESEGEVVIIEFKGVPKNCTYHPYSEKGKYVDKNGHEKENENKNEHEKENKNEHEKENKNKNKNEHEHEKIYQNQNKNENKKNEIIDFGIDIPQEIGISDHFHTDNNDDNMNDNNDNNDHNNNNKNDHNNNDNNNNDNNNSNIDINNNNDNNNNDNDNDNDINKNIIINDKNNSNDNDISGNRENQSDDLGNYGSNNNYDNNKNNDRNNYTESTKYHNRTVGKEKDLFFMNRNSRKNDDVHRTYYVSNHLSFSLPIHIRYHTPDENYVPDKNTVFAPKPDHKTIKISNPIIYLGNNNCIEKELILQYYPRLKRVYDISFLGQEGNAISILQKDEKISYVKLKDVTNDMNGNDYENDIDNDNENENENESMRNNKYSDLGNKTNLFHNIEIELIVPIGFYSHNYVLSVTVFCYLCTASSIIYSLL